MVRGDHLYYFRAGGAYSHHGIDCGDGTVIHYESSPWLKLLGLAANATQPRVTRASLAEFLQGHEVLVRSYVDAPYVDDADTALERAESRLGEANYDIFGNNCEHFVVWCKTGRAQSSQVNTHRVAADAVIQGAPVGALLLRAARRVPGPYRGVATLGAVAVAGAVYASTFFHHRAKNMDSGVS